MTRKRVTARIQVKSTNARRLRRIEREDITFDWRNEDILKTEATMLRPHYETRRRESTWTPPPPPRSNAWERKTSNPTRPAGGHSDVGATGRETAPCPGGYPGAGAGSGAAGTQIIQKVTIEEFRETFVNGRQSQQENGITGKGSGENNRKTHQRRQHLPTKQTRGLKLHQTR